MNNDTIFRNLLNDLRPATLSALIDLADGMWLSVFEWPLVFRALKRRGLARWSDAGHMWEQSTSPVSVELTEFGAAFVTWYRSRDIDLPVQEQLL